MGGGGTYYTTLPPTPNTGLTYHRELKGISMLAKRLKQFMNFNLQTRLIERIFFFSIYVKYTFKCHKQIYIHIIQRFCLFKNVYKITGKA